MAELTVLNIGKEVSINAGQAEISALVSGGTTQTALIHQAIVETGRELRANFLWPQLKKTHTITTTADDPSYAFPGDFWRMINRTQWDQTNQWEIYGPMLDSEYNLFQYGVVQSYTRKRFRVFGADANGGEFFLQPAPSANETISFDYIRSQWFLPKDWSASESVTSGTTYRSSAGNIYLAQTTATTGATRPTHTGGTVTDGTVDWLYVATQTYGSNQKFQADTDFPLLDSDLLIMGGTWRYREKIGEQFDTFRQEFYREWKKRAARWQSAPKINLADTGTASLLTFDNIPEANYS